MRDKGYDVIILNFPKLGDNIDGESGESNLPIPSSVKINGTTQTVNRQGRDGGADYIERNAFLLVKLIQQVNQTLTNNGSTEKIVVVGPSMGGLISRYALAYMEKKQAEGVPNMDHNCRLWISFDSPHEGANIPLAVQENLKFFGYTGEIQEAKDKFLSNLRVPAARQMLIEQTDGLKGTSPFYTNFYSSLKANGLPGSDGFPVNLRKVALLNGAGDGTGTYSPGVEILNGEGRKTFNLKIFEVIDNFIPAYTQSARITKQRIAVTGFIYIAFITQEYFITNTNSHGSMDAVPGSTFNATGEAYDGFYNGLVHRKAKQTWNLIKPYHSFIPTISALGFKNSSFDWTTRVDDRNLVCSNEIYFDNYYIPSTNQEHIYLNTANINWLTDEIDNNLGSYSIAGNSALCTCESYSIAGVHPGATVTWSASPVGSVSLTPNGQMVTVCKIKNGTITLTATINSPACGNTTLTKTIYAGLPYITQDAGNPYISHPDDLDVGEAPPVNQICTGQQISLPAYVEGASFVNWSRTYALPTNTTWSQTGNTLHFYLWGNDHEATFKVSASNSCGTAQEYFSFQSIGCGGGPGNPDPCDQFIVSPNPAISNIIVYVPNIPPPCDPPVISKTSNKNAERGITQLRLFDNTGILKKQQSTAKTKQSSMNISGLTPGIYFLEISDGAYKERQKVVIR